MTAAALTNCKKTVLSPYYIFLKCVSLNSLHLIMIIIIIIFKIGWRTFKAAVYDMNQPFFYQCCNFLWPSILIVLLIMSCITQVLLCFSRDLVSFIVYVTFLLLRLFYVKVWIVYCKLCKISIMLLKENVLNYQNLCSHLLLLPAHALCSN